MSNLLSAPSLSASATASRAVNRSKILRIFSRAFDDAPSRESRMAVMSSANDGRDDELELDERRCPVDVVDVDV